MSKLRSTFLKTKVSLSKSRFQTITEQNGQPSQLTRSRQVESRLLQGIRCSTDTIEGDQQKKDKLYHKHIKEYRESMDINNAPQLSFLTSLRRMKDYRKERAMTVTNLQPFEAAAKETINQKIKKSFVDIKSNPNRIIKASYRWWHNKSRSDVRSSCDFECNLRMNSNAVNPEQSSFVNIIKPIRFKTIEERKYDKKDLICKRQHKLFALDE